MILKQVFKVTLPMFLMTMVVDVWDGVPEQTLMLLMNLLGWFR
jgi:hypothetical protein